MGYSLELQLVRKIDNPESHQFRFSEPQSDWDYIDINEQYCMLNVLISYEFIKIHENWEDAEFLRKTDGRCYQGEEGYEGTIYTPEYVLKFVARIENEINKQSQISKELEPYLSPNKRGEIEFNEEMKDIRNLCETAKVNDYFLKCLDR